MRAPVLGREVWILHLRELQIGHQFFSRGSSMRTTSVDLPEPKPADNDVGRACRDCRVDQLATLRAMEVMLASVTSPMSPSTVWRIHAASAGCRCLRADKGPSGKAAIAGTSQWGPTTRRLGSSRYSPTHAIRASDAGQRGSGLTWGAALNLVAPCLGSTTQSWPATTAWRSRSRRTEHEMKRP